MLNNQRVSLLGFLHISHCSVFNVWEFLQSMMQHDETNSWTDQTHCEMDIIFNIWRNVDPMFFSRCCSFCFSDFTSQVAKVYSSRMDMYDYHWLSVGGEKGKKQEAMKIWAKWYPKENTLYFSQLAFRPPGMFSTWWSVSQFSWASAGIYILL